MRTAYIGMGGNVDSWAGAPEQTLAETAVRLESLGRVAAKSSLYSTEPVGFAEQPRFVNAVVALETELEPQALLSGLLAIEQEFGRDRAASFANGPRTLDLDILLLGDLKISEQGLEIPHPRITERQFVLIPLGEIAPDLDAGHGLTVAHLIHSLQQNAGSASDAVVPMQSICWRAGADRADVCSAEHARSNVSDSDSTGGR